MSLEQTPEEMTSAAFLVRITVSQGRSAGMVREVRQFPAVLGRGKDVDVPLDDDPLDPKLSRHHVRIRLRGGCILLDDLSTNGTWVAEKLVGPDQTVVLGDDAEVQLGPSTVVRLQVLPDIPRARPVEAPPPQTAGGWLKNLIRGPQKSTATSHVVDIHALGRFQLSGNGVPVPDDAWQHRKAVVLLVYLADAAQPASPDRLHEILWPDAADGRQAVQTAVSRVRRALKSVPQAGLPDLVCFERKLYLLNPTCTIAYDVAEFETWVREARQRWQENDLDAAARAVESAVDLYRGPFLEGFDEGWVVRRRVHLERSRYELLEMLGTIHEKQGHPDEAVRVYQSILDSDPAREQAHLGMIRALAHVGRRDDAIRQCIDSMASLKKLLNLPPSPEMEALYRNLSEGRDP